MAHVLSIYELLNRRVSEERRHVKAVVSSKKRQELVSREPWLVVIHMYDASKEVEHHLELIKELRPDV